MKLKPRFTFLGPTPLVAPSIRALRRLCKFDAMGREAELAAKVHEYRTAEPFPEPSSMTCYPDTREDRDRLMRAEAERTRDLINWQPPSRP